MEQGDSSREVPPVGLEIMEQEQQDTATEALIPPIDHSRKRRRPNADGPKKKSSCWDHFIELTDVVERTAALAEGLICTQNWLKPARTYFKDISYIEEFGITEEIISEFQQCFITANIGAAGAGAAVGGATGAAIKMFCLLEFGILFSNVWLAYYETAHLSKSCELKATKLYNRSSSRIGIAELNHGKVNAQ
ncbi:hypothetical protein KIW84_031321 [Lathyrus oleraceus]|uniref:Uncharacterized protein n=1 Tax=Pisum sativum TaxID=3888 RepID=A0A9D4XUM8_PEA|nr:hypothetical protein KIW84_031321 [Pisum sativum]